MIVMETMVVIHLAKMSLLEKSCTYFGEVLIPQSVRDEVLVGKERGYADASLVDSLVSTKNLVVKRVRDRRLLQRAKELNIQRGEAEAAALYWQQQATYLASDDDSVRKKRVVLDLQLIGTPAIVLKLYQERVIDKQKLRDSLTELRTIGWLSSAVIDRILLEAT